jgi:Cro/C1-type HTH DNA-binding domain
MAERGMFSTTDIRPLLAQRGISLSVAQVYRLVAGTPERLNLDALAGAVRNPRLYPERPDRNSISGGGGADAAAGAGRQSRA